MVDDFKKDLAQRVKDDGSFCLKVFENTTFREIHVINKDLKTYFIVKEVAKALGYSSQRNAYSLCKRMETVKIRDLVGNISLDPCKEISGLHNFTSEYIDGDPAIRLIQEPDLYRLIFKSKKPFAEDFQDWMVEEVIPSIRTNFIYVSQQFLDLALKDKEAAIEKFKREKDRAIRQYELLNDRTIRLELSMMDNPAYFPLRYAEWIWDIFEKPTGKRRWKGFTTKLNAEFLKFCKLYEKGLLTNVENRLKDTPYKADIYRNREIVEGYHVKFLDCFREKLVRDMDILARYRTKDVHIWHFDKRMGCWLDLATGKSYDNMSIRNRSKKNEENLKRYPRRYQELAGKA